LLLVEGALAKVQGELGLIPADAAAFLHRACTEVLIDPAALAAETAINGVPVMSHEQVIETLHHATRGQQLTYGMLRAGGTEILTIRVAPIPTGSRALYVALACVGIFTLVVGGYGLLGIVTTATLRLAPRRKIERVVEVIDVDGVMPAFERRIADGYLYGDCQYATDADSGELLRRGVFSCYRPVDDATAVREGQKELAAGDWDRLLYLSHADKRRAFEAYAGYYLTTSGQIYWSDTHQLSAYVDDYHVALDRRLGAAGAATEMITEIYVPRAALGRFLEEARREVRAERMELIYGTIRLIERDREPDHLRVAAEAAEKVRGAGQRVDLVEARGVRGQRRQRAHRHGASVSVEVAPDVEARVERAVGVVAGQRELVERAALPGVAGHDQLAVRLSNDDVRDVVEPAKVERYNTITGESGIERPSTGQPRDRELTRGYPRDDELAIRLLDDRPTLRTEHTDGKADAAVIAEGAIKIAGSRRCRRCTCQQSRGQQHRASDCAIRPRLSRRTRAETESGRAAPARQSRNRILHWHSEP